MCGGRHVDRRDTMPQTNTAQRSARRRPHYPSPLLIAISKPSKSAKKREFSALQVLGEELIGLSNEQLGGLGLDEGLIDAVIEAKAIKSHGALRRQKQLIGKMMRYVDPQPIRTALLALGESDRIEKSVFRRAEYWRDRIVDEGLIALAEYRGELGIENLDLSAIAKSLLTTPNDRARRELQRKLFREIHRDLTMKMQSDTN